MLAFLLVSAFAAQDGAGLPDCCTPATPTAEFAALADDPGFRALHTLRPSSPDEPEGKMVGGESADGSKWRGWLVLPEGGYKGGAVLMFHEWWGLNRHIRAQAELLSKQGYAVLALDLYGGRVAETPEDACKYMQAVNEEAALAQVRAGLAFLKSNPKIQAKRVGTLGWCFGGGWSMRAALLGGKDVDACVIYYGMPERDPRKLKDLHAPILGIFGSKDASINPQVVEAFSQAMREAGKAYEVLTYDAGHAFANPSGQNYNSEAAVGAWEATIEFLAKHLSQ